MATVLSQACGSLIRDLVNGHFGCPPRTALLPDGLSPIVWFVFCVPGKAFQPARRVAWGQPISQLRSDNQAAHLALSPQGGITPILFLTTLVSKKKG